MRSWILSGAIAVGGIGGLIIGCYFYADILLVLLTIGLVGAGCAITTLFIHGVFFDGKMT